MYAEEELMFGRDVINGEIKKKIEGERNVNRHRLLP